jgi:hypothetical protein
LFSVSQAKFQRDLAQPSVQRPKGCPGQDGGHEQVHVDLAQSFAHQPVVFDALEDLCILGVDGHRQLLQKREDGESVIVKGICPPPTTVPGS